MMFDIILQLLHFSQHFDAVHRFDTHMNRHFYMVILCCTPTYDAILFAGLWLGCYRLTIQYTNERPNCDDLNIYYRTQRYKSPK